MKYQPQSARPNAGHQCTPPPPIEMLRAQVCSNGELSFLMEAHDGLSATIAQRSGFKGLWASGLSIACSLARLIRKRRPRGWRAWCKALIRRRIRL